MCVLLSGCEVSKIKIAGIMARCKITKRSAINFDDAQLI